MYLHGLADVGCLKSDGNMQWIQHTASLSTWSSACDEWSSYSATLYRRFFFFLNDKSLTCFNNYVKVPIRVDSIGSTRPLLALLEGGTIAGMLNLWRRQIQQQKAVHADVVGDRSIAVQ